MSCDFGVLVRGGELQVLLLHLSHSVTSENSFFFFLFLYWYDLGILLLARIRLKATHALVHSSNSSRSWISWKDLSGPPHCQPCLGLVLETYRAAISLWNKGKHLLKQRKSWCHRGGWGFKGLRDQLGIWGLDLFSFYLTMSISPVLGCLPSSRNIISKSASSDYSKIFNLLRREGRAKPEPSILNYTFQQAFFAHLFVHAFISSHIQ